MTYTPEDFGPGTSGPAILWLRERLDVHGFNAHAEDWTEADRLDVQAFQLAQGWNGAGADGLPGPMTLQKLAADPALVSVPADVLDLASWKLTLPVA